jgi:hypothetical protein
MTKAMTRGAQKRAKRERAAQRATAAPEAVNDNAPPPPHDSNKPTPERRAMGAWAKPPKGTPGPMIDLAADMIGRLLIEKRITHAQEQAARLFQELRAGFEAELGVAGYGSCLNDSRAGYDGSDGNAEAMAAWRRMEGRIGRVKSALLQIETAKGPDRVPNDLGALRTALDCVNG